MSALSYIDIPFVPVEPVWVNERRDGRRPGPSLRLLVHLFHTPGHVSHS